MLTVFCADVELAEQIRISLDHGCTFRVSASWPEVERRIGESQVAMAVVEWIDMEAVRRLSLVRARYPWKPLLLVTRWDIENARRLKDVHVDEVVWIERIPEELSGAVERARGCALWARAADWLEGGSRLTPTLRRALTAACRAPHPPRSVAELSLLVELESTTLRHHWRRCMHANPLRLEDFVDWLLLLRALALKQPGRSWRAVASEVGVPPRRLQRISPRLLNVPLADTPRAEPAVRAAFERDVLDWLK